MTNRKTCSVNIVTEKYRTLQQITSKHSLPLLVDHKASSSSQTVRKRTSAAAATASLGTLMLKELQEMRFLALNFIKNGNVIGLP